MIAESKTRKTIRAFKEAVADTSFAFVINVPLNFVLVEIAFRQEFTAFETSVMLTTIFTIFSAKRCANQHYLQGFLQKAYKNSNIYKVFCKSLPKTAIFTRFSAKYFTKQQY